jgi:hypothetical protein
MINVFEMSYQQAGFGLQLQLDKIKVSLYRIRSFWDGCDLCIHHPILGLSLNTSPYLWYRTVVANGPES